MKKYWLYFILWFFLLIFIYLNFSSLKLHMKNESSEADSFQDKEHAAVFAFQTSLCAVCVNFTEYAIVSIASFYES